MRLPFVAAGILVLSLCALPAHAQSRAVPVLIGGPESSEGCAGTAVVSVRSGSTLNLRSGPGLNHPVVARLPPGQSVSVCQLGERGWLGVVVHRTGRGASDCGLSDAGPRPKPYAGLCRAGWVSGEHLRLSAG